MAATSLAGSISSNFVFVTKVPLLMKATSNDEKRTQGYILQEISNISKTSLSHCQSLLKFLLERLSKKSPLIKNKVLHILKYLVVNGHSEFRSRLRHNPEIIKQTATFNGELDPIHGDGLNMNVRTVASELEQLLFDVDNPKVELMYKSLIAPNPSGGKMEGFGCDGAPPKKQTSFMDAPNKIKESLSAGLYKLNLSKHDATPSFQQSSTYPSQPSYTPVLVPSDQEDVGKAGIVHGSGNISSEEHETIEKTDYYETKLVNDITAKGGIRSTPSKETLKDFVDKLSSLDYQVILKLLDERLQNPSPNVKLKSLCVLEYLLRCNLKSISRSINDNCGTIHSLVTCNDKTVAAKAKKIALAIASYLKQEELDRQDQLNSPPSYDFAKELPIIENKRDELYEKKVIETLTAKDNENTEMESLFSGMKFPTSNFVTPPVHTHRVAADPHDEGADLLGLETGNTEQGTGISSGFVANCETSTDSVDIFDPVIRLESTKPRGASPPRNSNLLDSILGDSTTGDLSLDLLMDTKASESNVKLLQVRTQHIENTSKVSTTDVLPPSCQHTATSVDLLTLQPPIAAASSPFYHGGLGPSTNLTSSLERRPFPKDMKQEVTGFGFLRKSSKKDAFSFVSDEIEARKTVPK